jgi:3-dehydroquinate synthase
MESTFTINDRLFNIHLSDMDDTNMLIKSSFRNYSVNYMNNSLIDIVKTLYNENDFILIDKNVYNLNIESLHGSKNYYLLDAVEKNKTIDTVLEVIDILYKIKFSKKNKLIVIGGGITQDIGTFIAAIYIRGIDWVYVPTTLLAIVDSAIGSKSSLNRHSKNILGLFYPPTSIYVSNAFLQTLNDESICSGLGEALKLSLIGGKLCFNLFLQHYKSKDYTKIIKLSSLIKKTIIEHDEYDRNERKILNFGHEFGHAIEEASDYYVPHGIAVLFGMYMINHTFYDAKHLDINNIILEVIPNKFKEINLSYDVFVKHLQHDKKNVGNNLGIIVLDEIGKTSLVYKPLSEINTQLHRIFDSLFSHT